MRPKPQLSNHSLFAFLETRIHFETIANRCNIGERCKSSRLVNKFVQRATFDPRS